MTVIQQTKPDATTNASIPLLEPGADLIQRGHENATEASVTGASIADAEAKILTTEIALQAANKLFELSAMRSTLEEHNLDRHWRNARAHTLHDPVRRKFSHVRERLSE